MLTTYWHDHMTSFVQIWENEGLGTNRKIKRMHLLVPGDIDISVCTQRQPHK